jgi:uncharacterized membrane protein
MRWIVVVGLVIALTGIAAAQDTGGSMGGGDWGGGGGGGGDYSYSGGGGGDYSYSGGGSDYSYSGGGGSIDGAGIGMVLVFAVIVIGVSLLWESLKRDRSISSYGQGAAYGGAGPIGDVDVTALRVALDARVRPFVQKELDRIAKAADTKTQQGLVTMLHEVALLLRRLRDAWVYGGAENHAMSWKQVAQSAFQQHASHARALFRTEVVRNAAGVTTTAEATARTPRSDEGPGIVLVTLIVAARQELFTVQRIGSGDDLRRALEVLSALTAQTLVAVEIVWTPADPADRMSSVELETLLRGEVFPIHGAMVGKVVCSYCSGPFPAELMSCPHCGAPARDAAPLRSAG